MRKPSEKLKVLFEGALALETDAERADYLNRACPDAQMRQEVEALLEAHRHPDSLFAEPTVQVDATPAEVVGAVIGRYKLLEVLGEGGFGVVWLAEQKEPVRRRVALKVIKLGMDTRQVVARFEAERQALALMDHPNIAKVFDAGTVGDPHPPLSTLRSPLPLGRPYFVMELVRGIPITKFCDENKLATDARLNLFVTVCHAVQHAHQKGIIHRDLKPSNVLVTLHDGVPVPKIIDFGIAKATQQELTDKTIHTLFQQFIGTPAYVSPEQAEMSGLDVDTRSDIYSLGVLLYELLTGRTPFDSKDLLASGLDAMRRTIREQEPARPSTRLDTLPDAERTTTASRRATEPAKLVKLLRGDLDWIVTASYDHTARIWDADTGQPITPPLRHGDRLAQATFSNDGRWVVTASWDATVRLWSATTGGPITPPIRLGEGVRDARLSAKGRFLVAASGSTACVWHLGREERPVEELDVATRLLSGHPADAEGPVLPFDVKEAWRALKAQPAESSAERSTAARAWHRRALAQALDRLDLCAARFHADHLFTLTPGDDTARALRARLDCIPAGSTTSDFAIAEAIAEARSRIPPAAADTPDNLIDLSNYYTRPLADAPDTDWPVETYNLSTLARGVQVLAGVKFDLRGMVRLLGNDASNDRSTAAQRMAAGEHISGIRIARCCRRLHFLHGTGWVETAGKEIAQYVIHYADGEVARRPVRYDNDVRNFIWLTPGDLAEHPDAVRAWTGTNALTAENGLSLRLYKSVWENPRPDVPVASVDFVSTMTACHPFLIAMTAE